MATTSIIAPVYKSIVRHVKDLIDELNATNLYPLMEYHDWESRGDENKLPLTTLLGPEGFSFDENKGLWIIRMGLGLSSFRDTNLMNEIELVDILQQRTGEGCKVPLREMVAGAEVSQLIVDKWQLMPMGQSEIRNYRTIGVELSRTGV